MQRHCSFRKKILWIENSFQIPYIISHFFMHQICIQRLSRESKHSAWYEFIMALLFILTKDYGHFFKMGPKYILPTRIDCAKYQSIVEKALHTYCKRWCKKEALGVGVYAPNDLKNEFLRIVDIRKENLLLIQIYTNSQVVGQWIHWKWKRWDNTINMSFLLLIKQQITSSLYEKDTVWMFWRGNCILREHTICSADVRQTSFASYRYSHENDCQKLKLIGKIEVPRDVRNSKGR